jgi:PAS domain-containing protein
VSVLEEIDSNFTITATDYPENALDRLSSAEVDCIVSAYEFPETDAVAFLESVRDEYPDMPFILFPAAGSEHIASEAIAADVTAYLPNRSEIDQSEELAARIREHVVDTPRFGDRQRLIDAIEAAQGGISILDADGRFVYVNEACAELYGYDPAHLPGLVVRGRGVIFTYPSGSTRVYHHA